MNSDILNMCQETCYFQKKNRKKFAVPAVVSAVPAAAVSARVGTVNVPDRVGAPPSYHQSIGE
jgi:hypothetical protein